MQRVDNSFNYACLHLDKNPVAKNGMSRYLTCPGITQVGNEWKVDTSEWDLILTQNC